MKGKVVVITGAAAGIGKALSAAFKARGATVCDIDMAPGCWYQGDIAEEATLNAFAEKVLAQHGGVDYLINNACITRGGIDECGWEDFNYVLRVGVSAPYLLARLFRAHFRPGASIVNLSSSRWAMSQPYTESYTATKGGITALTHALAVSLGGTARVNAIAPGWIDTTGGTFSAADHHQQLVKRVGEPQDIVNMAMFLCGEESSFITGQIFTVDGGMSKLMIYHGEYGWTYEE